MLFLLLIVSYMLAVDARVSDEILRNAAEKCCGNFFNCCFNYVLVRSDDITSITTAEKCCGNFFNCCFNYVKLVKLEDNCGTMPYKQYATCMEMEMYNNSMIAVDAFECCRYMHCQSCRELCHRNMLDISLGPPDNRTVLPAPCQNPTPGVKPGDTCVTGCREDASIRYNRCTFRCFAHKAAFGKSPSYPDTKCVVPVDGRFRKFCLVKELAPVGPPRKGSVTD